MLELSRSYSDAAREWDAIETVTLTKKGNGNVPQQIQHMSESHDGSCFVNFRDVWDHLKNKHAVSSRAVRLHRDPRARGAQAPSYEEGRRQGGALAGSPLASERGPFDDDDQMHLHTIQTLYMELTGEEYPCPRYGSHWENIGFQGKDPATDLRGVGFLALVNTMSLLTTSEQLCKLGRNVYQLSLSESQHFPFMVLSINVTRIALLVLKAGKLNRECNEKNSVIEVLNRFYAGILYKIYSIYKSGRMTINDAGNMMKDTERYAMKKPQEVLAKLNAHLKVL
ncbi:unnamed protein product [Darwinula stevensoni]|uniref:ELMO domain-containing protein n=1 Tax=Darwinula stevensoni TaxID=69355 RepID=A0A7R9AEZ1_9CRUS|nr:unnamed protein product [Darwinula stevensoni]CAG0902387.1 unnamed protein product [Darwinula stevensoni]